MTHDRSLPSGMILSLLLFATVLLAGPADWKRTFNKEFSSSDSWVRAKAIKSVDPDDKDGVRALLKILAIDEMNKVDWYIRSAVIEKLSAISSKGAWKEVKKTYKKARRLPRVQEGILLAAGRRAHDDDLDFLIEQVEKAKHPRTRQAALDALGYYKKPEAVEAILEAWSGAPARDGRLGMTALQALERSTQRSFGLHPERWSAWYAKTDHPFDPSAEKEEASDESVDKKKYRKTRVRGLDIEYETRGEGIPLLVIPEQEYTSAYFKPYLRSIEDVCEVTYVELPEVTEFDDLEKGAGDLPYYPVDELAHAFDELRKELKVEKFALLAHGFNSIVAQRYLSLYPDRVSHMILIGPISGDQIWEQILNRVEARGQARKDQELMHMAQSMWIFENGDRNYNPESETEQTALDRKAFSLYFADPNDPEIMAIWKRCRKEDAPQSLSPDFTVYKQKQRPIPFLICVGEKSLWSDVPDAKRIAKFYGEKNPFPSYAKVYEESAMMPFMEQSTEWAKDVKEFFRLAAKIRKRK